MGGATSNLLNGEGDEDHNNSTYNNSTRRSSWGVTSSSAARRRSSASGAAASAATATGYNNNNSQGNNNTRRSSFFRVLTGVGNSTSTSASITLVAEKAPIRIPILEYVEIKKIEDDDHEDTKVYSTDEDEEVNDEEDEDVDNHTDDHKNNSHESDNSKKNTKESNEVKSPTVFGECSVCTEGLSTFSANPCHHLACKKCWMFWLDESFPPHTTCMICAMPIESVQGLASLEAIQDSTQKASSPFTKQCLNISKFSDVYLHELLRIKDKALDISSKVQETREHIMNLMYNQQAGGEAIVAVEQVSLSEQFLLVKTISFMSIIHALESLEHICKVLQDDLQNESEKSNDTKPNGLVEVEQALELILEGKPSHLQWGIVKKILQENFIENFGDLLGLCGTGRRSIRNDYITNVLPAMEKDIEKIDHLLQSICDSAALTQLLVKSWSSP